MLCSGLHSIVMLLYSTCAVQCVLFPIAIAAVMVVAIVIVATPLNQSAIKKVLSLIMVTIALVIVGT